MKQHYLLYFILMALLFSACSSETDFEEIDLGYAFFPNESGKYIDYEVDSIHYGITVDTVNFYLRELVADDFIDAEGQPATRLERYKKFNLDDEWVLTDVWSQRRTTTAAERDEENRRFVRMIFPVENGKTWDGNSYNTLDPWNYRYSGKDESYSLENLSWRETVTVNQRNNTNLVDQEFAFEVYARNIGLVHKVFTDLNFQNGMITGDDVEWRYIGNGWAE